MFFYGAPGPDPKAFMCLVMWATTTASTCTFGALTVPRRPSATAREPVGLLRFLFYYILLLGIYATGVSLMPDGAVHDASVLLLGAATLLPAVIAFLPCTERDPPSPSPSRPPQKPATATAGSTPKLPQPPATLQHSGGVATAPRVFESVRNYSLCEMLRTVDAWMIWFVGVVVVGGGTILATNLAQIVESAGAPHRSVPMLVTVFSTGNLLGRLCSMCARTHARMLAARLHAFTHSRHSRIHARMHACMHACIRTLPSRPSASATAW